LFFALELDEAHRRPGRRLRDRLSIMIVVLLRLDVRAHVFRRHQAHRVALSHEKPAEMMRTTARLHGHDTGRHRFSEAGNALRPHASSLDHRSSLVKSDEAAAVLAQVDAKYCDLH
jgi:hypothetical protein